MPLEILLGIHYERAGISATAQKSTAHDHDVSPEGQTSSCQHDHHHERLFESWSYESDSPLHLSLLQQVLSHLPNTVHRAKGFVYAAEKPHRRLLLQLVGRRATIAVDSPWEKQRPQTRLVFIAGSGTCNVSAIEQALNACVMAD